MFSATPTPADEGRRRFGLLSLAVVTTVSTLACSGGRWEDRVLLRPNGDLLATSEEVSLTEDVPGDVMAAAGSISFDGTAGGSYLGAAGEQEILGRIDGSVRAAGATVLLDASVGRNVTMVGGGLEVARDAAVEGNAYVAGGKVRVLGSIAGDLYVGAGEVDLQGDVGGDVRLEAATVTVGPTARVGGELRYRVEEDASARISPQATLVGGAVALEPREADDGGIGIGILRFIGFLLVGTVLVALLPGTLAEVTHDVEDHPAAALGLGLLGMLLVPVAVVVTGATLVGLPLALTAAVLFGLSLYLAPVLTGLWLGGELLQGRDPTDRGDAVLLFLVGGAVVALAGFLPWVGWLVRLVAICFGLGAVILMVRDRRQGPAGG